MKTIALILLLTGAAAWAQSPSADADSTNRDDAIRRALHEAEANAAGTNSVPTPPQDQAKPPRKRSVRNLPSPSVATNTSAVTVVNATNPVVVNATTNPVIVNTSSNPVVINPAASPVIVSTPTNPVVVAAPPVTVVTPPAPAPVVPAAIPVPAPAIPAPTLPTTFPQFPRPTTLPTPVVANQPIQPVPPAKPREEILPAGEIDFSQATVDQILDVYARLVNRTILKAPNLPQPAINLRTQTDLTKSEAIQAFESILTMNGISLVNSGDKFVKAVPFGIVNTLGAPMSTNDEKDIPEADRFITQIVQVQNAKPSELVPILTPFSQIPNSILAIDSSGMLIIRDYSVNVKRMLELVRRIDVVAPLEYIEEVIPIKYAKASEISSALSSLGGNTAATIGAGSTGSTGGRPGGFNPSGAATGSLGGQPGGYPNAGGVGANSGLLGGGSRTSSFNDHLKALGLKSASGGAGDFTILGQTKIIADERTNSLLVFAGKADMAMIKKIIHELDTVLAQVLIEAIIMEVTLDDSRNLGVSYLQNQPSAPGNYFKGIGAINNGSFLNRNNFTQAGTNGIGSLPGGFSYAAAFGNDFQATLTAIATDNRIHVLSRPRIQTSHAVTATLKIGDTVPYVTGTYFGGINGQASSQYQQTFVGIDLEVTPLINSEGLVVMDITQDVQQLGTPTIIDNNPVPTTTQRSAQAKVSVRNGDTIILGGFISTTKSRSKSGVPFLKDIPGLGYMFRSTSDSKKRVELVVLIRPTVLPTPESAALVATHERNKLPNVKAAFAEDQADENKQLRAADRIKVPPERE